MHPALFILALITGCAYLWLAGTAVWRNAAPLAIPFAVIGVAVLAAAGLMP